MTETQNSSADAPLRVRVGIVTKDRAEYLERCLSSCFAQSYEPKDVVVWDNSRELEVQKANAEIIARFPDVKHEVVDVELSLIDSRARMMEAEGFDLFCCLDDDAWFMRGDEIEMAVREFEKDTNVAGVAFDILSPDRPKEVAHEVGRDALGYVGCGHVLRRSHTLEVGNYAKFPGYYGSEEKDLCLRFLDHGWAVRFLPGVHVWHDKTTSGRDWGRQHRSGTLNDLIFGWLRVPMPEVWVYLPGKAVNLVCWGRKGGRQEFYSSLFGVWDFLKFAPSYWKKRQPVKRATFRKFFVAGRYAAKPKGWQGEIR